MKRSSLMFFVTIVGASIFANGPMGRAEAAPVSIPQQQEHQLSLAPLPQPSARRIRIKSKTSFSRSHQHRRQPSSHQIHQALMELNQEDMVRERVAAISAWYHQRSNLSIHPRRRGVSSDRDRLQGHAVLDEEDDDAGNELLDTEDDDLLTIPDGDDTIEGQILEEEDDESSSPDDETEELIRLSRSSISWLHENGLQDRDVGPESFEEDDMEEEEEDEELIQESNLEFDNGDVVEDDEEVEAFIIPSSNFGGNVAAADMAAGEP